MSRTYRITRKGRRTTEGKLNSEYKKACLKYGGKHWNWQDWIEYKNSIQYDWLLFSYNPSEWSRDMHTVPRRAEERKIIKKIVSGYIDADEAIFPNGKKPHIYYY